MGKIVKNQSHKKLYENIKALLYMKREMPFRLSWTHYLLLIRIANEEERKFYEIEAAAQNWSVREMERQFNSSLYERLVLSRDKHKVKELGEKGHTPNPLSRGEYKSPLLGGDKGWVTCSSLRQPTCPESLGAGFCREDKIEIVIHVNMQKEVITSASSIIVDLV